MIDKCPNEGTMQTGPKGSANFPTALTTNQQGALTYG